MLTLFGALHMMTDLDHPDWIKSYAQFNLYAYHNEVKPTIAQGIYKFEFDVEPLQVELWAETNPYSRNFAQFREGVYFYRPSELCDGEQPTLVSVERVTRAEIETDPAIPKIEVVLSPEDLEWLKRPSWWTELWAEQMCRDYAPKWISEHHITRRLGNHFVVTYIPATIKADQLEALHKARRIIDDLVEAINCNFEGLRRHLF